MVPTPNLVVYRRVITSTAKFGDKCRGYRPLEDKTHQNGVRKITESIKERKIWKSRRKTRIFFVYLSKKFEKKNRNCRDGL